MNFYTNEGASMQTPEIASSRRSDHRRRLVAAMIAAALVFMGAVSALAMPQAEAAPKNAEVATINITLADSDPAKNKLSYIHASKDHKVKAKISVEDPNGTYSIPESDALGEIKGRGNFTWNMDKRPYQIKFPDNVPLLGMESQKTWVLLANHADPTMMRNKIAYDFAASIGLPYSPQSRFVDVRINGEYLGSYLVSEKTEVKKNRVDLKDKQGVLVELDNNYGTAEDHFFYTTKGRDVFVLKDAKSDLPDKPEPLPADTAAGWKDMQDTLNELDNLLLQPDINWRAVSNIIDVDSFVKYYFVFELAENPEIVKSSVFFYKDGPNDKLHAGPIWDFDSSFGQYDKSEHLGALLNSEYVKNAQQLRRVGNQWFTDLYRAPEFTKRANELWTSEVGPEAFRLVSEIDANKQVVQNSAKMNFSEKWKSVLGGPTLLMKGEGRTYKTSYDAEVSYFRNWVNERVIHLNKVYGNVPIVRGQAYVRELGWLNKGNSGLILGTTGQRRPMEALKIDLPGNTMSGTIEARSHVSKNGWSGWGSTSLVGTTGKGLQLEAVQFRLTGDLAKNYHIQYRSHVTKVGWQTWVKDSATSGTVGLGQPIEAFQIRLVKKSAPALTPPPRATPTPTPSPTTATPTTPAPTPTTPTPTPTTPEPTPTTPEPTPTTPEPTPTTPEPTPTTPEPTGEPTGGPTGEPTVDPAAVSHIKYRSHVQGIGWMAQVQDGKGSGTKNQNRRIEALEVKVESDRYTGNIEICGHVQKVGWQPCVDSSKFIGTVGMNRGMEAFTIELTGELADHYSVEYQSNVMGVGWQDYVADGAISGTVGQGRSIEGVRIVLKEK